MPVLFSSRTGGQCEAKAAGEQQESPGNRKGANGGGASGPGGGAGGPAGAHAVVGNRQAAIVQ
eukprot:8045958-Lingulodinium_polyedra.AAC.1